MPTITHHVAELHELIDGLRRCVTALASTHGDTAAIRRIVNDAQHIQNAIDRLEIDAAAPELACGHTAARVSGQMIPVPATEYHFSFWQDVDHEGIGGQSGAYARTSRGRKRR